MEEVEDTAVEVEVDTRAEEATVDKVEVDTVEVDKVVDTVEVDKVEDTEVDKVSRLPRSYLTSSDPACHHRKLPAGWLQRRLLSHSSNLLYVLFLPSSRPSRSYPLRITVHFHALPFFS